MLTSSEAETAEEFSKRLAQFGAPPPLLPTDPKAVLGAELDDEHAAWCPPPTESSPLPQADTSSATWTRIQCDGGCDQGAEHKVQLTGAGFTLANGPFSYISSRTSCRRIKDDPSSCTCYTDNKCGACEGVFFKRALFISDTGTNNEAEMAAVYHSLLEARERDLQYLDIHTDSEFVVNCITGHNDLTIPTLCPYLYGISEMLANTTAWRVSHIHREANGCADALATEGKALSHNPAPKPPAPQYLVLPPRTLLPTSTPIAICTSMMGRLSPPARSFAL